MRGEDDSAFIIRNDVPGTPPRARGRQNPLQLRFHLQGNTPACAGKTPDYESRIPEPREHPRVRGEDIMDATSSQPDPGTPPRARGRPPVFAGETVRPGNTPACAGKTFCSLMLCPVSREHPRVRGEDHRGPDPQSDHAGTPPRARGRQDYRAVGCGQQGNTPACAGKTVLSEGVTL